MNYGGGRHPMEDFPMLGFPDERLIRRNEHLTYYVCRPQPEGHPEVVCAVWKSDWDTQFNVQLFRTRASIPPILDSSVENADPIDDFRRADDPVHAQAIIFHLIETHLPTGVTNNEAA